MPQIQTNSNDIKRKLRDLKKLEIKIRFGYLNSQANDKTPSKKSKKVELVWNKFFNLKEESTVHVYYPISKISLMTREEFKEIISEYFYHVYYWYYKENGISDDEICTIPDLLTQFGLSSNATIADIKKKFRELAKIYHPDNGGDGRKFIELLEKYKSFNNFGND